MGKKGKGQGKKPKGRAAQRQKNSPGSSGWQQNFIRSSDGLFDDSDENEQRQRFQGFAQNSPRGFQQRAPNVKLRHQAISFVSAGNNAPAKQEQERSAVIADYEDESEDDAGGSEEKLEDSAIQTNIVMNTDVEISEGAMAQMNLQSSAEGTGPETDGTSDVDIIVDDAPPKETLSFFVDTTGDPTVQVSKAKGKRPVARSPSPAPSDSSEEVVLFHGRGRNTATVVNDPVTQRSKAPPLQASQSQTPHITDGLLAALEELPKKSDQPTSSSSSAKGWGGQPSKDEQPQQQSQPWKPAPSTPYWKKGKPRPDLDLSEAEKRMLDDTSTRRSKVVFAEPESSLGAEESIASLQSDFERALNEENPGKVSKKSKSNRKNKQGRKKDNRQVRRAIISDDEDDEEAAYIDYMENMKAELGLDGTGELPAFTAINSADAGPSLVVDGKEIAENELLGQQEDEWEDESSSEEGAIGQDLSELEDGPLNLSDLDSSDLEDELIYTEKEQWEDEEDLRQRRMIAMSDEQIARLFAKQQELGIDDEELVIDNGMFDEEDGVGELNEARAGLVDVTNSSFGRSANKHGMRRSRRGNGDMNFPDASALADTVEQYCDNGFDIMDFERPSLRPKKKGRKGKLPPEMEELSDEELKEELTSAWDNDRAKKRLKKAEREELRMQGLLSSTGKKGKADLSQKYLQGMTLKQVMDELRIFLQEDGQNTRPFPPMDKKDRKALHEVADKFNLKSKSVGTGSSRFPILYKTSRTVEYSEAHFDRVMYKSSHGFFKNQATKGKRGPVKPMRAGRGGGFDKAAVALRNGEVVGANAAEIGRDSMGHKLMEKMGWTKGTALGKDRDGMLLPVEQVMRSGRAGLG